MATLSDPNYLDNLLLESASLEVFEGWMGRGLGRTILYLERHDPLAA